jgi:hypothetical protein
VNYTGIDWSGSPGRVHGPSIVFAAIHIDGFAMATLNKELTTARLLLGRPPDFVFSHTEASPDTHRRFYAALSHMPFEADTYALDKATWHQTFGGKGSRGSDCECDGIIRLVMACPALLTAGRMLYLDLPRKKPQRKRIEAIRTAIRKAMRGAQRATFEDVQGRPDDSGDGAIIQVADMIAGEVREHGALASPHLPPFAYRIRVH